MLGIIVEANGLFPSATVDSEFFLEWSIDNLSILQRPLPKFGFYALDIE